MRIQTCWFCSASVYPGRGTTFVRNDATVFVFCRTKCFKLFRRKVHPKKVKWTKICRQLRGKELTQDPIQAFERRVHRPMIYSRAVVQNTLEALPEILRLKKQREDLFIKDRILTRKEELKGQDVAFINKYSWLLNKENNKQPEETVQLQRKEKDAKIELN